jgi:xanthine dehydrogenase/oxidase
MSLNPLIDIGQVEGAFVQGLGYHLTEKLLYNEEGQLISNGTWEYKVPSHRDIPIDLRVTLLKNSSNPMGVLNSKASGEPPLALSCAALFAAKHAIMEAR